MQFKILILGSSVAIYDTYEGLKPSITSNKDNDFRYITVGDWIEINQERYTIKEGGFKQLDDGLTVVFYVLPI